jgi:DNA-binding CsgD family transcriptional regulator
MMTQPREPNGTQVAAGAASSVALREVDGEAEVPRVFGTSGPTIISFLIAVCILSDLVSDIEQGLPLYHMVGMGIGCVLSLVGLVLLWRLMRSTRAQARALQVALDSTRVDLQQWRSKTSEVLHGLGTLIDRQFAEWQLSPAEREVALLLLKGLSLKAIADLRETSERTVRQQALAIYRKGGIAGRAELSAFFLEDMLLPQGDGAANTAAAAASGAQRR